MGMFAHPLWRKLKPKPKKKRERRPVDDDVVPQAAGEVSVGRT